MDFIIGDMASLLEGTRISHQAPSMKEYLTRRNQKKIK
jgi:hypothetical protein